VRESAGAFAVPPTPTTLASHTGWVTDITYRWALEGSLYLAVIVDLFGIVLLKRIAAAEAAVERPVPPLAIVRALDVLKTLPRNLLARRFTVRRKVQLSAN
jgi:hypothetical protein